MQRQSQARHTGLFSSVNITTDNGIDIAGVIQSLDPGSDVSLTSGTGILLISGFVEAG